MRSPPPSGEGEGAPEPVDPLPAIARQRRVAVVTAAASAGIGLMLVAAFLGKSLHTTGPGGARAPGPPAPAPGTCVGPLRLPFTATTALYPPAPPGPLEPSPAGARAALADPATPPPLPAAATVPYTLGAAQWAQLEAPRGKSVLAEGGMLPIVCYLDGPQASKTVLAALHGGHLRQPTWLAGRTHLLSGPGAKRLAVGFDLFEPRPLAARGPAVSIRVAVDGSLPRVADGLILGPRPLPDPSSGRLVMGAPLLLKAALKLHAASVAGFGDAYGASFDGSDGTNWRDGLTYVGRANVLATLTGWPAEMVAMNQYVQGDARLRSLFPQQAVEGARLVDANADYRLRVVGLLNKNLRSVGAWWAQLREAPATSRGIVYFHRLDSLADALRYSAEPTVRARLAQLENGRAALGFPWGRAEGPLDGPSAYTVQAGTAARPVNVTLDPAEPYAVVAVEAESATLLPATAERALALPDLAQPCALRDYVAQLPAPPEAIELPLSLIQDLSSVLYAARA